MEGKNFWHDIIANVPLPTPHPLNDVSERDAAS